jgi:hypothetical protein
MQITRELAKGQVVCHTFAVANVAASQTDVQINDSSNNVQGISLPFDSEIIAITADLSAAATVGTLSIGATIDGTEDSDTTLASITTQTARTLRVPRGKARLANGQKLGVEITTSADWNGTTADLVVNVYVALELAGV